MDSNPARMLLTTQLFYLSHFAHDSLRIPYHTLHGTLLDAAVLAIVLDNLRFLGPVPSLRAIYTAARTHVDMLQTVPSLSAQATSAINIQALIKVDYLMTVTKKCKYFTVDRV